MAGVLAVVGLLVVLALGAYWLFGITNRSVLGPGELMSLDLGTGSASCAITGQTRTFATDEPVYMAATFDGPLPAGTTVTYGVEFEGSSISTESEVLKADANCASFPILEPPLQPGHYKFTLKPDTGPPISAEFDVE